MSQKEEDLIEAPHHSSWIMFTKSSLIDNNHSRVIMYINIKLVKLHFSLRKNIVNH